MVMKPIFILGLLLCLWGGCRTPLEPEVVYINHDYSLVPLPQQYTKGSSHFVWNAETVIVADAEFEQEARYLQQLIAANSAFTPALNTKKKTGSVVYLIKGAIDADFKHPEEAYALEVDSLSIRITATTNEGLFRGTQTLRQLLPVEFYKPNQTAAWGIPALSIKDAPKFPWRGLLLDCCRHFFDKEKVKQYIDLLAYYRMNTLHWHLTEDQGWRIAIDHYPKLTEVGAWRKGKDGQQYGGFYTKATIREIIAYAAERHITVVPEIELPGHAQAALAAYPHLSCTGELLEVATTWGVFKDVYCAGNDSTFQFLETVLSEVMELFPSDYIHIGGDECPKYRWEHCAKCQQRIAEEGLHNAHELQRYFISRINTFLQQHQKRLIGWDEILEGGLRDSSVIVQSWRGMTGALQAANQGQCAISSPTSHAYFDYKLDAIDLKKVYQFSPIPADYTGSLDYILGGECNMWTERVPNDSVLDQRVFPRLLAMAEVLWSAPEQRDYDAFYQRVQQHYPNLEAMGVQYGAETVPIQLKHNTSPQRIQVTLLPGVPNLDLYYTTNNQTPSTASTLYTEPIAFNASTQLQIQAFKGDKPYGSPQEQHYTKHRANGIEPQLSYPYSKYFTGGGPAAVTDGVRGSLNYQDGHWQAVQKVPMEITIDLDSLQSITKLSTTFFQDQDAWIFLPAKVAFFTSKDGKVFQSIGVIDNAISPQKAGAFIEEFALDLPPTKARFVKMKADNITYCPDWHRAAGSGAWLFVDEFVIE